MPPPPPSPCPISIHHWTIKPTFPLCWVGLGWVGLGYAFLPSFLPWISNNPPRLLPSSPTLVLLLIIIIIIHTSLLSFLFFYYLLLFFSIWVLLFCFETIFGSSIDFPFLSLGRDHRRPSEEKQGHGCIILPVLLSFFSLHLLRPVRPRSSDQAPSRPNRSVPPWSCIQLHIPHTYIYIYILFIFSIVVLIIHSWVAFTYIHSASDWGGLWRRRSGGTT